jgi:hypothetical protein
VQTARAIIHAAGKLEKTPQPLKYSFCNIQYSVSDLRYSRKKAHQTKTANAAIVTAASR